MNADNFTEKHIFPAVSILAFIVAIGWLTYAAINNL